MLESILGDKMKKFFVLGILMIVAGVTFLYKEPILKEYYQFYASNKKNVTIEKNKYYRDYDFLYVQNTDDFQPHNKQDIKNILYTVLNSGVSEFSFYCPKDYDNCISDVKELGKDQIALSNINNYVHPFNSFKNISTQTDSLGKVKIEVEKAYSDADIKLVSEAVKNVERQVFDDTLSTKDQIKAVHDYIIDNSKYDSNRTDNGVVEYKSDLAYGPLIEGYGICGGYSDAMELFLEDMNVKSYKISSESHVWNAVNLYDDWYHLDLTWDDPVTNTGVDLIEDKYFMISTSILLDQEKTQHNFDSSVYLEFK